MDGIAKLVNEPQLAEERFQTAEGRMQHWDEFIKGRGDDYLTEKGLD